MHGKLISLIAFVLLLGLSNTSLAPPMPVDNPSFELDKDGFQITEVTNMANVGGWTLQAEPNSAGTSFTATGRRTGDPTLPAGFAASAGNIVARSATLHGGGTTLEIYQIISSGTDANIVAGRQYTLTFDAIDYSGRENPDVNGVLFFVSEGNDVELVNKRVKLTSPTFNQPGFAGWETITVSYTPEHGEACIGNNFGIKFNAPLLKQEGVFACIDNVRLDWEWATKAYYPNPEDGATDVPKDANLSWRPGVLAADTNGHGVYFGSTWAEVNSATTASAPEFRGHQSPNTFDPASRTTITLGETYYWRIDEVNEDYVPVPNIPAGPWKGDVWRFTAEGKAREPDPEDGDDNVARNVILHWKRGAESLYHDIYFGPTEAGVATATTDSSEFKYRTNLGTELYDAGGNESPEAGERYFWRIDEVNWMTVKGDVWYFTAADYIFIDDFDFYADTNELRAVWKDSYTGASGEGIVYVNTDPDFVVDGNSMMFEYWNNSNPYYSETKRSYSTGQDWSYAGNNFTCLEIDFFGDVDNVPDPPMYVKLSDDANTAQVNHTDFNDVLEEELHTWYIPLKDFTDVNLSNITTITLGVGDKKGEAKTTEEGTIYFDDFRLHPPRCFPEYGPVGDFTGDCKVDFLDLKYFVQCWVKLAPLPADCSLCDIYPPGGDGTIGFKDFAVFRKHWLEEKLWPESD